MSARLLVHVGTEKTGSSFVQKLCAASRAYLRSGGIFFPRAGKDERLMVRETVSPGNARELNGLIESGSWRKVSLWLRERAEDMAGAGCGSLLLSHELLFVSLSSPGALRELDAAAHSAGFDEIAYLLVIRDPVEQALSLYKHRAKKGKVSDIGDWLESDYSTPRDISEFLEKASEQHASLAIRKYKKDSGTILSMFFDDWLSIQSPPVTIDEIVNPSLTLSELQCINYLAQKQPAAVSLLYAKLVVMPVDEKANDAKMEAAARARIAEHVVAYQDLWKHLDALLQKDGGLSLSNDRNTDAVERGYMNLSDAQFAACVNAIVESRLWVNRARFWASQYARPVAGRLRTRLRAIVLNKLGKSVGAAV